MTWAAFEDMIWWVARSLIALGVKSVADTAQQAADILKDSQSKVVFVDGF